MSKLKKVLFASLIATIMLPLVSISLVKASETYSANNVVIKTEKFKNHIMEGATEKLVDLDQRLEGAQTQDKEDEILRKMSQLKQDTLAKLPQVDPQRESEYRQAAENLLFKLLDENSQSKDKRIVPFTTLEYDSVADAILVGIEPDYATPENMQEYADFVEGVVPNHIKVILEPGEIVTLTICPTGDSECAR